MKIFLQAVLIISGITTSVVAFQLHSISLSLRINESHSRLQNPTTASSTSLRSSFASDNQQPAPSSYQRPSRRRRKIHKDVLIVGGGLAGLSAAMYLSQIDPDRQITILDKHITSGNNKVKTSIASFAAAGMLAPQSERLPKGDYLDLCLESKRMFPDFADMVECMAQEAGEEGSPYLPNEDDSSKLEPWNIGYVASGGFLAPAFAGDNIATWAPPEDSKNSARWLDAIQVRELEPNLHSEVVGGWWFPEDASVDARRLASSLRAACVGAGVSLQEGPNYEVSSLDLEDGVAKGLWLQNGKYIQAKTILIANGAWMRNLLPVPIEPHKGQSLSLRMPKDRPPILRRVLFAQDSYIVPKADGRIVIGATVEAGSFDPHVTPAGIMHILNYALQLVPALADLPLEETWAGLRPTTPDKGPIIGKTPWDNLYLAGGYWRNGVLLAPKTGELLAMLMAGEALSEQDQNFLQAFSWDRFTSKGGGAAMAANARYAASMYPVHSRKSGVGVAAAVGTELGSYSTAVSAQEERKRDRQQMFETDSDDAFERAANMGKEDGSVFSFENVGTNETKERKESKEEIPIKSLDSHTSSSSSIATPLTSDLHSVYQSIRENKSKKVVQMEKSSMDDKPDPGFRIFHISKDKIDREVPPYTAPGDFLESMQLESPSPNGEHVNGDNGGSFDGYQTILEVAVPDEDIQQTMRDARLHNRATDDDVQEGALSSSIDLLETIEDELSDNAQKEEEKPAKVDLSDVYQKIREQKAASTSKMELNNALPDDRPDPGFRIFHIATDGTDREVPPYTTPGIFLDSIESYDFSTESQTEAVVAINPSHQVESPAHHVEVNESSESASSYDEKTYDGYEAIIQANSSSSREDELEAMRKARRKNRSGSERVKIEESELLSFENIEESELHL
jgi:thiazole synthase